MDPKGAGLLWFSTGYGVSCRELYGSVLEFSAVAANKWVATATSISCLLVFSCKDGRNFSPFSIGPSEASILAYWPSCIAAAAILYAANEIPNWSLVEPEHAESWCEGLRKEKIIGCYQLMQELVIDNNQRKPPKVLPQMRVTIQPLMRSCVSSSSSSPSSSSSSYKRRKLNNCLWVDDDKGSNSQ